MKEGIVDRFRSLPMSSSALVLGHISSDLVRNIISAWYRAKDCADKFDTGTSDYRVCLQLGAEG